MTHAARRWFALAIGLFICPVVATAQVIDSPPPTPLPPQAIDPNRPVENPPSTEALGILVSRMAERVRSLGDEVTAEMGRDPAGRYLAGDVQELTRALDDFREAMPRSQGDAYRIREDFSGIDETWRHLHARFSGPVLGVPSILRAAARVDEADAQLVQALGMNPAPPVYDPRRTPVPNGPGEIRRLAHALADRAEGIVAVARVEMGAIPGGDRCVRDAAGLAVASDRFHDTIDSLANRPDAIAASFDAVSAASNRLQVDFEALGMTPGVRSAWGGYRAVENLLRAQFRPVASPVVETVIVPAPVPVFAAPTPPTNLAASLAAASDQMIGVIDSFLDALQRAGGRIPEWPAFQIETQRLRETVVGFRNDAARGVDLGTLANEYREVDVAWLRLSRRLWRVSRGQPGGPNIDKVKAMGAISEQIHQALGMPSYAPSSLIPQ